MDIGDELRILQLMEEEDVAGADIEKHLSILTCLGQVQAAKQKKAGPRRGCFKFRRRKSKPRQRMEGHTIPLYQLLLPTMQTITQRVSGGAIK
jgi:hypothetical protein